MNIMLVTPKHLPGPSHAKVGDHDVWFRSQESGLVSLPVDLLILAPGCTKRQAQLAASKTQATRGRIFQLTEITHEDLR